MPNLNDLDPDSPEYEAAMEAALVAEDRSAEGAEAEEADDQGTEGGTTDQVDEPSEAKTETTEAEQAEEVKADDKPGVASKDGKRVLPYAALKGARHEAALERKRREAAEGEAARLRQEIADLKAGKKPADDPMSDEKLDQLAADFPEYAATVGKLKEQRAEAKDEPSTTTTTEEEPGDDPVQDAIDAVPMLAEWQASNPEMWKRAVAIDQAIQTSPKWKGKPLDERFSHVAKLVAQEHDIQIEDEAPPSQTKQPTQRREPEKAAQEAPRKAPNTLSDFKGGAPQKSDAIDRLPPGRMLERFSSMTDDEIDAHLAKLG